MAIDFMKRIFINEYDKVIKNDAYEYTETLTSAGNGKSIIIPDNINWIVTTLEITTGSGKIQTSTSSISDIRNDLGTWFDWTAGIVTTNTQDFAPPVTAIRQVNVSGTTKMMLRVQ